MKLTQARPLAQLIAWSSNCYRCSRALTPANRLQIRAGSHTASSSHFHFPACQMHKMALWHTVQQWLRSNMCWSPKCSVQVQPHTLETPEHAMHQFCRPGAGPLRSHWLIIKCSAFGIHRNRGLQIALVPWHFRWKVQKICQVVSGLIARNSW